MSLDAIRARLATMLATVPPLPWKTTMDEGDPWWIVDADGKPMGDINGALPEVGPFIVEAVNALPELLTRADRLEGALRGLMRARNCWCNGLHSDENEKCQQAQAALAEGETT